MMTTTTTLTPIKGCARKPSRRKSTFSRHNPNGQTNDKRATTKMAASSVSRGGGVGGLDHDDDDNDSNLKKKWGGGRGKVMIAGRPFDAKEEEDVHEVGSDLISMSKMLSATCTFDSMTARIVVDVDPDVLRLLLRFSTLVAQHHNSAMTAEDRLPRRSYRRPPGSSAPSAPAPTLTSASIAATASPTSLAHAEAAYAAQTQSTSFAHAQNNNSTEVELSSDWRNRARHLSVVLGDNAELGEFFDCLNEEPEAVWEMHLGAERLLLEPAQTACALKFATMLDGLSIPLMETIWPTRSSVERRRASLKRAIVAVMTRKAAGEAKDAATSTASTAAKSAPKKRGRPNTTVEPKKASAPLPPPHAPPVRARGTLTLAAALVALS
jgi:hypothetical protein